MTAGVVTSATRPSNPQLGDCILETDTGNILYYYGPTDGWQPSRCIGGRLLGYVEGNVPVSVTGATSTVLTLTIAPNIVRGRKLTWIANFPVRSLNGGIFFLTDVNDNNICDRNWNGFPAQTVDATATIIYRESISLTQQINVTKKLKVTGGGTAGVIGQTSPPRLYNLFCFDDGFINYFASPTPPPTAAWGISLWDATASKWG